MSKDIPTTWEALLTGLLAVTVAVRGTLYSNAMQPKAWPANAPRDPTKQAAHLWIDILTFQSTANHPTFYPFSIHST